MYGKEVKMKEELIILVKQGVGCDLTQSKKQALGSGPFLPRVLPHSDSVMEEVIQPLRCQCPRL